MPQQHGNTGLPYSVARTINVPYMYRAPNHPYAQMALFVRVCSSLEKRRARVENRTTRRRTYVRGGVHNAAEEAGISLILIGS